MNGLQNTFRYRCIYPYRSWLKGTVENWNKHVRLYIAKETDISTVTDAQIARIRKKINDRPRETLKFKIPKEAFFKNLL